ncbi:MAG: choline dehydrogenase, partial [Rhodospirillaceae bacterium]|nr:choline dehydrogenase [Rhodospirillaceae bacterium]
MAEEFDYIVVGAGSAGCVLGARLSEDASVRVLVLEAGGRDWMPLYKVPMFAGILFRKRYNNWNYVTEPEPGLDGRRLNWPRGKVLGGSNQINGMVYTRGHRLDYDSWRQMGCEGWSYDDVLPFFKKSEDFRGPDASHHGKGGPLTVRPGRATAPLYDALIEAGAEAGYPVMEDFNEPEREGFGRYHFTIRDGRRWTTAQAFLKPAMGRPNLTVRTGCHATG